MSPHSNTRSSDHAYIETTSTERTASFTGSLRKIMTDRKRDEIVIERHGDTIESFEDWRARQ